MGRKKRNKTLTGKIVIFLISMVMLSNVIVCLISYNLHMNQSFDSRAVEAERIAFTMARIIDGDKMTEILDTLEKNDYWYEIKDYADYIADEFGSAYLYIVRENNGDEVIYFAEGSIDDPFDLGDTESNDIYASEMFDTLRTGEISHTAPYPSGDYGNMVSGFAAVLNSNGEVAGAVGIDFYVDDIRAEANVFGLTLVVVIVVFLLIFSFVIAYISKMYIGKPLVALEGAARQLAYGDMDICVDIKSNTEIGRLSDSFNQMVSSIKKQAKTLESIAQGDLTVEVGVRSKKDSIGYAIIHILENLNKIISNINQSSSIVQTGSTQISDGATSLASGASEQSAAIEEMSATISDIIKVSKTNAENANEAKKSNNIVNEHLKKSVESMEESLESMHGIDESSNEIIKVIKVIEDIAFQTNILALNASVEAARAGQYGKGFAVVAEEVRNLASKSTEAAKETAELIEKSVQKVADGKTAVEQTSVNLKTVEKYAIEAIQLVEEVAEASLKQETVILEMNRGVEQVSQVVNQNSAAAEELSAASYEMMNQSGILNELINSFNIK